MLMFPHDCPFLDVIVNLIEIVLGNVLGSMNATLKRKTCEYYPHPRLVTDLVVVVILLPSLAPALAIIQLQHSK